MMCSLVERDQQYVWHPFTQAQVEPPPVPIVRGEGVWLYDEKGKPYLDANSSWWTILHGHGHPHIAQALQRQFSQLDHVVFAGVTHPKAVEVAERLVHLLPEGFEKVFFSDNGSTAVEVAVKIACQYWYNKGTPKTRFLALQGAYHGDTFGAMSVGERDYFNRPFEPLFFDVDYLPLPTQSNCQEVMDRAEQLLATGQYAGFIFEPLVQGAAGMRIYRAAHLEALIGIARKNGVLTIADEVMTGFYRTGKLFAIDYLRQPVDLICLSKGLTGGVMPMGVTAVGQALFSAFLSKEIAKALLHGHSFTANPLACSAISASLDLLEQPTLREKVDAIASRHRSFVDAHREHPYFRTIGAQGTILSLTVEVEGNPLYFSPLRTAAWTYFLNRGILLRPLGNVLFFNPPYCITDDELTFVYTAILDFLDDQMGKR